MIVMKNNDFKSSKRILPSKKMLCTASLLISKEIEKYIQKKENQLVDKLQQAGFLSTKLTVRQADKLEEELTNILQSHNEEFISLLKKYQEQGKTLEDVLNALPNFNQSRATAVKSAINTAVYNNLTEMIPKVANKYLKNIDGELEIKQMTKTTVNWIKTWSKNLADIMNINTEEMLRNTLVNGINGGIGIDEISRNMVDNGALKTRVRARTTAVTEVLTANRIAAHEAIIQSPETNRKQWKHSGSYKIRPRENHIKMNGQVVLKTQPFKMIGADGKTYYPMIPGDTSLPPAERINCHCIVSPVLDDSVFNMPLEERQALQQKCIQEYDEFNGLNTENSLDNSQESVIIEAERMSSSIEFAVPKGLTSSREFISKFSLMDDDKNVQKEYYQAAKEILKHRSGNNGEDLFYYNTSTGKWYKSMSGTETGKPDYNEDILRGLSESKPNQIVSFHNHPEGMPPSDGDLNAAYNNGYKKGYTIGHNGVIFEYTAPKKLIPEYTYSLYQQKHLLEGNNLFNAQLITLNELKDLYGFTFREVK